MRSQPSPYSSNDRPVDAHLAEELGAIASELSHESLETLVIVARRLARAEETA
jgi:hypothetical protein